MGTSVYDDNTVDVTSGSATVVGNSTLWESGIQVGDFFTRDYATEYEIIAVTDDTHITLSRNYAGSTESNVGYEIRKIATDRDSVGNNSRRVAALLATLAALFVTGASDQYVTLNKTLSTDLAGVVLAQGASEKIRAGLFGSNNFAIQYLVTATWTDAINVASSGGAVTLKNSAASALAVGANGATNPVFKVDASTASVATGIAITGAAAAARVKLAVLSSGTNEGLSIDAKGSGTIRLGATSTGAIEISRNLVPTASDGAALGTSALMFSDLFLASGSVINWNNGDVTLTHASNALTFAGATTYTFDGTLVVPSFSGPTTHNPGTTGSSTLVNQTVNYGHTVTPSSGRIGYAVVPTNSFLSASANAAFGYYHPFDATDGSAAYKPFRVMTGTESGASGNPAAALVDRWYVTKGGDGYYGGTTAATSTTTGALIVVGGIGVGGNIHVGGTVTTKASATGGAGLILPHGAAPTSPTNGAMWTTTAGLFVRINGVTKTVTLT